MKEPQDAGKYQVNNDGTTQGQVIGDHNKVELHFYAAQDKATSSTKPQQPWNIPYLRNDYFTGREEILEQLHARFKAGNEYNSCFISYSSKDSEFAERLYADLQNKNVRCWYAPHDIKTGDRIRSRIHEQIWFNDKLLLVLSESSVASEWVDYEVETALAKERKEKRDILFPIRLDDAVKESKAAWAAHIQSTRNIGNFTRWKEHDEYQKGLNRLLRDLKER